MDQTSPAFLAPFPTLRRLFEAAERYAFDDPCSALINLRLFGEKVTSELADEHRLGTQFNTTASRQQRLLQVSVIDQACFDALAEVRQRGNRAAHDGVGEAADVLAMLPLCFKIAVWFASHRGFSAPTGAIYTPPRPLVSLTAAQQAEAMRAAFVEVDARVPLLGLVPRGALGSSGVLDIFVPPRFEGDASWQGVQDALGRGERLAIGGPPGSGKTTLARAIGANLIADPRGLVPFFLPATSWAENTVDSILRRARESLHVPLERSVLERWLKERRLVLLLDGADETSQTEALTREIAALMKAWPALGVLITGRPAALEGLDDTWVKRHNLAPWNFYCAWSFIERFLGVERSYQLWVQTRERPIAGVLLTSPLLTTLFALLVRDQGEPPSDRKVLLDGTVRTLLEDWPRRRGQSFADIGWAEQWTALEDLAAAAVDRNFPASFEAYARALNRGRVGERWIEFLIDETGLLVADGPSQIRWLHLSLRDHLALPGLVRHVRAIPEFVARHFDERSQRELLAALVQEAPKGPDFALRLIEALRDRPKNGHGAWYGASQDDWTDFVDLCVRQGMPLDDAASEALLDFVADDRVRIIRAMDAHIPTGTGRTPEMMDMLDGFPSSMQTGPFDPSCRGEKTDWDTSAWLAKRLTSDPDCSRAITFAIGTIDEKALIQQLRERLGSLFWMWPRSVLGCWSGPSKQPDLKESWPGDALSLLSGMAVGRDDALRELSSASDWFSRALCALVLPGGAPLREALVWLIARQCLSLGGLDCRPRAPFKTLQVEPGNACLVLNPGLPDGSLSEPIEAELFRGAERIGRRQPVVGELLALARLRTVRPSTSHFRIASWPDFSTFDAVSPERTLTDQDVLAEFLAKAELMNPIMYLFRGDTGLAEPIIDHIPIELSAGGPNEAPNPSDCSATALPNQITTVPRSIHAAEYIAAALLTRGLPPETRMAHLQHRLQARATLHLWPGIEGRLHRPTFDRAAEALLGAMAWCQATLTRSWPDGLWWRSFTQSPPDDWLCRCFWHLCWLQAVPPRSRAHLRHRRRLQQCLIEGGEHPVATLLRRHY